MQVGANEIELDEKVQLEKTGWQLQNTEHHFGNCKCIAPEFISLSIFILPEVVDLQNIYNCLQQNEQQFKHHQGEHSALGISLGSLYLFDHFLDIGIFRVHLNYYELETEEPEQKQQRYTSRRQKVR